VNEWLNDVVAELKQAKADQKSQAERLDLFKTHTGRVLGILKSFCKMLRVRCRQTPTLNSVSDNWSANLDIRIVSRSTGTFSPPLTSQAWPNYD